MASEIRVGRQAAQEGRPAVATLPRSRGKKTPAQRRRSPQPKDNFEAARQIFRGQPSEFTDPVICLPEAISDYSVEYAGRCAVSDGMDKLRPRSLIERQA